MALERLKPSVPGASSIVPAASPVSAQPDLPPSPMSEPYTPEPGEAVEQAVADGMAQAAPAFAEAVAAAMPQPAPFYGGRVPRRPGVPRATSPADPLARFFPQANSKRLEVYRLVADADGTERPHHAATFNGSDAAGFASLADFVRQRVANKTRRYGGYRCVAKDANGVGVATEDLYLDAPVDAPPAGAAADGTTGGDPIYGAVADFLRVMTQPNAANQTNNPALAGLAQRLQGGGPMDVGSVLQLVQLAQSKGGNDGPLAQALGMLLKRLEDADRFRNAAPQQQPVDVAAIVDRALTQQRESFRSELSALKQPAADPMAGMAAILTAMGTIMAATKGPDVATLIAALKPEPLVPPAPLERQPDMLDQLDKLRKVKEIFSPPATKEPGVLEQVQQVVAVSDALRKIGGGGDSSGNLMGILQGLVREGGSMLREGNKTLAARTELEKAQAARLAAQAQVQQAHATTAATESSAEPTPGVAAGGSDGTPPGLTDILAAVGTLNDAKTDSERLRLTLNVVNVAYKVIPEQRAHIEGVRRRAAAGDRTALADVREFIEGMVAQAGLSREQADAAIAAFEKHWDTLVARGVFGPPTGTAAVAPVAAVAPATAPAPTPTPDAPPPAVAATVGPVSAEAPVAPATA